MFSNRLIVAGMATMASRAHTFSIAFESIVNQVDYLYLYLDGHSDVPQPARNNPRVVSFFSRDIPGLRGNGKFLGLHFAPAKCLYLGVDDDIRYPPDYTSRLRAAINAQHGRAVVGYHGSIFTHPFISYRQSRIVKNFAKQLDSTTIVDTLGTGTLLFDTAVLRFDVCKWTHVNLLDLCFAIEAAKAKVPLICLPRPHGFLHALEREQSDSIYAALKRDDRRQTMLALQLQALKASNVN